MGGCIIPQTIVGEQKKILTYMIKRVKERTKQQEDTTAMCVHNIKCLAILIELRVQRPHLNVIYLRTILYKLPKR